MSFIPFDHKPLGTSAGKDSVGFTIPVGNYAYISGTVNQITRVGGGLAAGDIVSTGNDSNHFDAWLPTGAVITVSEPVSSGGVGPGTIGTVHEASISVDGDIIAKAVAGYMSFSAGAVTRAVQADVQYYVSLFNS